MPVGRLAPLAAQVATKTITRNAPPWIKSMVGVLDQLSGPNAMGRTLSNGTMIRNFGSKEINNHLKLQTQMVTKFLLT